MSAHMKITQRMRRYAGEFVDGQLAEDCREAADRIEELENALMEIGGIAAVSDGFPKHDIVAVYNLARHALTSTDSVPSDRPFPHSDGTI